MRLIHMFLLCTLLKVGIAQTLDFVPAVQPFINEACMTVHDNLSGVWLDGELVYWPDIPRYTEDPGDVDQDRFTFFFELIHPQTGTFQLLQVGSYLRPFNDYGDATCYGIQELKIWVLDEVTDQWYFNSQVITDSFLCADQPECDYGYSVFDVEFADYSQNYAVDTGYY